MTISVGDTIPAVPLVKVTPDGPDTISSEEYFAGRTVALFAVPGAFTPTCSAKHLPGFVEQKDAILAKGVDEIACTSVNDAFVMAAWAKTEGAEEYHLQEIYLSANDANREQIAANARQIIGELQKGQQPFEFYAKSYSEASTKAVGGDLGWLRLATLPQPLAEAAQQMQVGQVAGPIATPGGFSILYLIDKRTVGAADPRDARLSLKQLTIHFPANTTMAQAQARAGTFAEALKKIQGCGSVEKIAASVGAEVVDNDSVPVRSVPDPRLQQILLGLQVGQATPPFGSPQDGVRSLVLCGRDDPQQNNLPSANQIQGQLEQQRVNLRAQSKLRDLRRDAVIEYR